MATLTNYDPNDNEGLTAEDFGLSDEGLTAEDFGLADSDGLTAEDFGLA